MNVSFTVLWAILGMTVGYDLVVVSVGAFPGHTLQERMNEDFKIALFIALAYLLVRVRSEKAKK